MIQSSFCSSGVCHATAEWSGLCREHYWEMCAKAADPIVMSSLIEEAEKVCDNHFGDARFDKLRHVLQPFLLARDAQCREATKGLDELSKQLEAIPVIKSQVSFTAEEMHAIFHDENEP